MPFSRTLFTLILLFFLMIPHGTFAQPEKPSQPIIFGQTAALGGPASALGQGMRLGILSAFKEVNDQGGINGRQLKLIAYDDGYEPERAIENTKKLIHDDQVFALIGGVGTPTAAAIEPITSQEKIPFIAPFTGAEFLRSPFKRYVVNMRGSYWQETEEWIEHLTSELGIKRIAILYQDDSYGRAGLSGVKRALGKRDMKLTGEATYKRNTTAVKVAALNLRKNNPEAIVIVGAYKPAAAFIKLARKLKIDSLFVNISFVGSEALAQELGEQGEGVIISQVVPFPFGGEDVTSAFVQSYHKALIAYQADAKYGFVSLEGYMAGRLTAEILRKIEGKITRETFLDMLYELQTISLDDTHLHFGVDDNQGMDRVFMTVLQKDGHFMPVKELKKP